MDYTQEQFDLNSELPPPNHHRTSSSESSDDESEGSIISDCCSSVSGSVCDRPLIGDGLIELQEGDKVYDLIKSRLLSCLGPLGNHSNVVYILRNGFRSVSGRAKFQAFRIFAEAAEQKHGGGHGKVKYAWCAAGRDEIRGIVEHGFGEPRNDGLYGRGLYLSPDNAPLECMRYSVADEDGLRFLLLCRVVLGKSEVVRPGTDQSCPSSTKFDSGVDNLSSPKKYIVWSTHMNTHVLPEFVVCLRAPANLREFGKVPDSSRRPSSPWIPFPVLISAISKFLPLATMRVVLKHYKDQRERKISRSELIQHLRRITGDELLVKIIKSFRQKVPK